ncbi:PQQ-binding-like beta-propeller repeat protein [Oerskovia flava]|uniref:outer membrane protein assembly factor BamB family protein n=1 Tax=Oerskovia flava TaxID=2986422 RepID=UPI0022401707|nr:PQQ-binding-like beta-propeller repeat protein [Oerskovia sp. JB1-3-2]
MVRRRRDRGAQFSARAADRDDDPFGEPYDVPLDGSFDALFDDDPVPSAGARTSAATAPPAAEGAETRAATPAHPRSRHHRGRVLWATAATVVAVAGSVVFTAVVENARVVDTASIPGVVRPLHTPPATSWTIERHSDQRIIPVDGAMVLVDDHLVAYGTEDGSEKWSSEPLPQDTSCLPRIGDEPHDLIVCISPDLTASDGQRLTVTTYDPATGERTGSRTARVRDQEVALAGSHDLVRLYVEGTSAVIVREDARTGEPRWEQRVPRERGAGAAVEDDFVGGVSLAVSRGVVSVLGRGLAATFTHDGIPLEVGDVWSVVELPDGRYAGNQYGRGVATVFGADGVPEFQVNGRVLEAPLTDGSVPGVIVANTFGGMMGVDAATGATLWELTGSGSHAVLRLDGQIVIQSDSVLRSVDVRTGEQTWSVRVERSALWLPLTDGESVFVTSGTRGVDPELVSISLRQGYVQWRAPLPLGAFHVFAADGRIMVLREDDLVALG